MTLETKGINQGEIDFKTFENNFHYTMDLKFVFRQFLYLIIFWW